MKKLTFIMIMLCAVAMLFAAAPINYYDAAEGKTDNALRLALQGVIDNHTVLSYDNLEDYYPSVDATADNKVWDMYSTCTFEFSNANCPQKNVCDCWNKEHSVPQSWFSKASPMKSDLFHVFPTDARVNNFRSNYPYGETSSTAYVAGNSSSLGRLGASNFAGYSGTVYEPDDQFKGDFARTYFYMATRYADKCSNWTGGMFGSNYNGLNTYTRNLLLKWHREDPVSVKETLRNDAVYVHQHNRNPFIDNPDLVEYIWGDKKGENWYETSTPVEQVTFANLQVYPNPANQVVAVTADGVDQFNYTIFDISGQLLHSGIAQSGEFISIEQLNAGVYLLQIDANSKKQVMKLVVTK